MHELRVQDITALLSEEALLLEKNNNITRHDGWVPARNRHAEVCRMIKSFSRKARLASVVIGHHSQLSRVSSEKRMICKWKEESRVLGSPLLPHIGSGTEWLHVGQMASWCCRRAGGCGVVSTVQMAVDIGTAALGLCILRRQAGTLQRHTIIVSTVHNLPICCTGSTYDVLHS